MEIDEGDLDRYYGISDVHLVKSVNVKSLMVRWDLYTSSMNPEEVTDVNRMLTEAATEALEKADQSIFWQMANKLAWSGAADTEPVTQFKVLWLLAFGEDE